MNMPETALNFLESLNTPLFWVSNRDQILWLNQSAKSVLTPVSQTRPWSYIRKELASMGFEVSAHRSTEDSVFIECTERTQFEGREQWDHLQQISDELRNMTQASSDEWFATDGQGVTIRVNSVFESVYGVRKNELIGRSVFELEQQRVFYPSVVARVLHSGAPQTVVQQTSDGRRLIVTGYPQHGAGKINEVITKAIYISFQTTHRFNAGTNTELSSTGDFILESESDNVRECVRLAHRIAPTDTSVLILGETGVGKSRLAHYIHQSSHRSGGPFVEINCATIPESLLESELFGYEAGAFTGARKDGKAGKVELAHGGTLFLDEIGEIPISLQGKLLDLIQHRKTARVGSNHTRTINVRIIAATNRPLEQMVQQNLFRADLYYRLNVIALTVPPLRERSADIPHLAETFFQRLLHKYGPFCHDIHPSVFDYLTSYEWPGNIRELENLLERLVLVVDEGTLQPKHLPEYVRRNPPACLSTDEYSPLASFQHIIHTVDSRDGIKASLDTFEKYLYEKAIEVCHNTYELADYLRVSQSTAVRKLHQFSLNFKR